MRFPSSRSVASLLSLALVLSLTFAVFSCAAGQGLLHDANLPEIDGISIIEHVDEEITGVLPFLGSHSGNTLLKNIIVGTMDGNMVCLDSKSGRQLWSVSTGQQLVKSSFSQLIPSLNGNLYLYHKGKLEKHPMNVYDIVAKSPFSMNDDMLYLGSKETQLWSIDPHTGDSHHCSASEDKPCGEFDIEGRILVMRADFVVKAVDRWTGEMRWNVTLGEFSTTSSIGVIVDDSSQDEEKGGFARSNLPPVPTHGMLSGMDGTLSLVEVRTGRTIWSALLPSPAIHMQNNIYTSASPNLVLGDLKFVPQLLLHLDNTQLRENQHRVFIGEHQGNLIAVEQLAQYNPYEGLSPPLGSQLDTIKPQPRGISFPSSSETTPAALPYPPSESTDPAEIPGLSTLYPTTSYLLPTRKCSGPSDTSLDCLLGIHYIQIDPCCVGDGCMCDATLKLPDKPSTPLKDRPVNHNLTTHPSFSWDSGDYDTLLRAIIIFDSYRQEFRTWPIWMQLMLPTGILAIGFYFLHRSGRVQSPKPKPVDPAQPNPEAPNAPLKPAPLRPSIPDAQGMIRIGKLEVLTTKILGHGSSGTIVFEGMMNGRKVAVKRMLKTFFSIAERETLVLSQTDEHPNVIRYYTTEEDSDFIYLALSFAERSLADHIEDDEVYAKIDDWAKRNILQQLALGMLHLHDINVVHRDIKPQNVLITSTGQIKISDMGLAKKLENEAISLSTAAQGTIGWQAPEIVIAKAEPRSGESSKSGSGSSGSGEAKGTRVKVSKRVDIFSLGCLFYYVLTRRHPFGDRLTRESNIVSNRCTLEGISMEAADLIAAMLRPDPKHRPTAGQILDHPYFWDANKRLRFLKDASDFFEFEKPNSDVVLRFEAAAERSLVIPHQNWVVQLPEELLSDLNKFRKYNGAKLRDLLRVIRNKAHHYRDLPKEAQDTFGALPDGFLDYFCKHRFPSLLIFTWNYARRNYSTDKVFSEYFPRGPGVDPDFTDSLAAPSSTVSSPGVAPTSPMAYATPSTTSTASSPATVPTEATSSNSVTSSGLPPGLDVRPTSFASAVMSNLKPKTLSNPSTPQKKPEGNAAAKPASGGRGGPAGANSAYRPNQPHTTNYNHRDVSPSHHGQGNTRNTNAETSTNWRSKN